MKTNRLLHWDQLVEFFLIDAQKGIGTLMDIGNGVRIANVRSRYYTDYISSLKKPGDKNPPVS